MTKLYLRATTSGLPSGTLPTAEQSSLTADDNFEADQTTNRLMSNTKGSGQTSLANASLNVSTLKNYYVARWVSPLIYDSIIQAQTWTYNFAANESNVSANFPVNGASQPVRVNCYVWKPSDGSKVGTILDGNTASTITEAAASTETAQQATFSGSAVTGITPGDACIVFEAWFLITQAMATSYTQTFYFDGTTEATSGTVSNHASFIQSADEIDFTAGPTAGNLTVINASLGSGLSLGAPIFFTIAGSESASTTEALSEITVRKSGVFSRLSIRVITNSILTANSTFTLRKNGADTSLVATIPISTVGYFEDLSNSVSVAAGDKVCLKLVFGSASGSFTPTLTTIHFSADDGTATTFYAICGVGAGTNISSASTTLYIPTNGKSTNSSAENDAKIRQRLTGNYSKLFVYVSANARTTNTVFKSRKNGADGNLSVTFASGETGIKENTSNSDDVVAGDDYNYAVTTSTGTGTLTYDIIKVEFETLDNKGAYVSGDVNPNTQAANTTRYYPVGGFTLPATTEADHKRKVRNTRLLLTELHIYLSANTVSANSTATLFKNGASTAITATLTASTTGLFSNTANTIEVKNNDELTVQIVTGATGTSMGVSKLMVYYHTGRISKQLSLKWNNIARISKQLTLKWNDLARISKQLTLKWNIEESLERVSKQLTLKWNTTGRISKQLTLKWNDVARISKQLTLKWNDIGRISKSLTLKWDDLVRVSKSLSLRWDIIGRISKSLTLKWNDIARISKSLTLKWNNLVRISKQLTLRWDDVARVSKSLTLKWNNLSRVSKQLTLKWNILVKVSKQLTLKWNTLQRVGGYSIQFDGINSYVDLGVHTGLWNKSLTKFSASVWVKIGVFAVERVVFHFGDIAGGQDIGCLLDTGPNVILAYMYTNGGSGNNDANKTYSSLNTWANVIITFDNSLGSDRLKIFVDLAGGTTGSDDNFPLVNLDGPFVLGSWNYNVTACLTGKEKDFRFWNNKALDSTERTAVYNNSPTAPTPDYHLKMEEGTGNPVDSIDSLTTTLQGGATWNTNVPSVWTGKFLTLKWDDLSRVSKSLTLKWDDIARISKQLTLKWDDLARISKSLILKWDILLRVSKQLTLKWDDLQRISKDLTLKWNDIERISKQLILKWNIQSRVSKQLTLRWDDLARISKQLTLKWNNIARISKQLTLKWDIQAGLERISKSLTLKWNTAARVSKSLTLKWDTIQRISKSLTLLWNTHQRISKELTLKWDDLQRISKELTLKWSSLERISKQLTLKWNSIARVSKQLILKWNTNQRISKSLTLKWDNLQRISKSLVLKWHNLERISKQLTLKWNNIARVSKSLTLKWDDLSRVSKSLTLKWHDIARVSKELILKWNIEAALERISKSLTLKWNTEGRVSKQLTLKWDNLARVSKQLTLKWDNLKRVSKSLTLKWDDLQLVSKTLTLKWDKIVRVSKSLTLRWIIASLVLGPKVPGHSPSFIVRTGRKIPGISSFLRGLYDRTGDDEIRRE